ncbi:MAG: hypothetical protein GY811_30965, partial [Myxococcales bacterium]|nr:hypothetical protein [Myxococcales bacterium]
PYEDNEEVGITPASQGGFGVPVLVRTAGLIAGESRVADVQLNVEDGDLASPRLVLRGAPSMGDILAFRSNN